MSATLTESQLKSALPNEQIVAAKTKGFAVDDTVNPVAEEIAAALSKVDTFAAGYVVPAGTLTGWSRDLAAHNVAKRLGTPTDRQVACFDRANKELEDLRDGMFKNLPRVPGTSSGKVASGGKPKI